MNSSAFTGSVFCLLLFFPVFSYAQEENWDMYMAKVGDKPGSVLVDLGLITRAPDSRYPYLVITGPQAQKCNKNGLPDKDEIDRLEDVLDATNNFLTGITAKVLAGTLTCDCKRVNYYYVKDTMDVRSAIMRMYKRGFKDYNYALTIRPDPDWTTYLNFLYPDESTFNWMENDKLVTKLLLQGDSLTQKRNIYFTILFKTEDDRKKFQIFSGNKKYHIDDTSYAKETETPYLLKISTYDYVNMDTIDPITSEIKEELKKYNGAVYKGWDGSLKNK